MHKAPANSPGSSRRTDLAAEAPATGASSASSRVSGERPEPGRGPRRAYSPPAFAWEEEFVALADNSWNWGHGGCIPGHDKDNCDPPGHR